MSGGSTAAAAAAAAASSDNPTAPDLSSWLAITEQVATALDSKSSVEAYWRKKTRPDGRLFPQTRQTTVQQGVLTKHSIGSALVKLGSTQVIAAVSYLVGQPVSTLDQGDIIVTLDNHVSLQSYLQRLLEETLDLSKLSIVSGQAAFRLQLTVQILNAEGNLRDSCLLACVAALLDTKLPKNTIWESGKVYLKETTEDCHRRLNLPLIPVPLSMGIWCGEDNNDDKIHWIVDSTGEEEEVLQNGMTIVVNALQPEQILSLELSGYKRSISRTDLALAAHMAAGRAKELRSLLAIQPD